MMTLPAMTAAEARIVREGLGLTVEDVAARMGITERVVRRWEAGAAPVPGVRHAQYGELIDFADAQIEAWVSHLLDATEPLMVIPRGERDGWPAGWWRALAARVMEQVPGCRVVYGESRT